MKKEIYFLFEKIPSKKKRQTPILINDCEFHSSGEKENCKSCCKRKRKWCLAQAQQKLTAI